MKRYQLSRRKVGGGSPELLSALNEEQQEVVACEGGPMLVVAGAGTGKTRTLTHRVAWLLSRGVPPERIMLCTFTNRAAREMVRRVESLVEHESRRLWAGTFHHLGNRILRRHARLLGYGDSYSVLDREDSVGLIQACASELGLAGRGSRFPKGRTLSSVFGYSGATGRSIEETVVTRFPQLASRIPEVEQVLNKYVIRKLSAGFMDFDDLLLNWRLLLVEHPEILELYAGRFQHVLVDEYQDTNFLQTEIVSLMGSAHGNVMVVGDDAQSIYSFRGADSGNMRRFSERNEQCRVFRLTVNYRSTPEILTVGNRSIAHNTTQFEKELTSARSGGMVPVVISARDVHQQAEFVVQRILDLLDEDVPLHEIAVLYRAHSNSMELQVALNQQGIPFEIRSGMRFFEQAHIKDVLSFLRVAHNGADELAFRRAFKLFPGVGDRSVERLWAAHRSAGYDLSALSWEGGAVSELPRRTQAGVKKALSLLGDLTRPKMLRAPEEMISAVYDREYKEYAQTAFTNPASRGDDIVNLSIFAGGHEDVGEFLQEIALTGELTAERVEVSGPVERPLVLSTIHQAKGLEWRAVFLLWAAEGRIPSAIALREDDSGEAEREERRLFYVSITRAQDELYLIHPLMHVNRGRETVMVRPSRFLSELEDKPGRMLEEEEVALAEPDEEGRLPLMERWVLSDDDETE